MSGGSKSDLIRGKHAGIPENSYAEPEREPWPSFPLMDSLLQACQSWRRSVSSEHFGTSFAVVEQKETAEKSSMGLNRSLGRGKRLKVLRSTAHIPLFSISLGSAFSSSSYAADAAELLSREDDFSSLFVLGLMDSIGKGNAVLECYTFLGSLVLHSAYCDPFGLVL
nr:hypothetical protein CFP56_62096 [Quercus suber]